MIFFEFRKQNENLTVMDAEWLEILPIQLRTLCLGFNEALYYRAET